MSTTIELSLSSVAGVDLDERPRFRFYAPKRRDIQEAGELLSRLQGFTDKTTNDEAGAFLREVDAFVRPRLFGWVNQINGRGEVVPFAIADLDAVASDDDLCELLALYRVHNRLDAAEKKASASPSPSKPVESATSAPTQAAA